MPAIQIERLNEQIRSILDSKLPADLFLESLQSFMEVHANRAFRPGLEVQHAHPIESYQLAPVIKQQLQLHMIQLTKTNPVLTIEYADLIWHHPYVEMKELAAMIIGALPINYSDAVFERISNWSMSDKEVLVRKILFDKGTTSIRQHNNNEWIEIIKVWLESGNNSRITAGLLAIQVIINDQQFENLPVIFNMIHPLFDIQNEPAMNALLGVVKILGLRSPHETFYMLRSLVLNEPTKRRNRFVRRCFAYLARSQQKELRNLMDD